MIFVEVGKENGHIQITGNVLQIYEFHDVLFKFLNYKINVLFLH